ncbi:hypothetical protein C8R47DRAFT_172935 [Mycena vitilis]|nr:hypothetical protein C8R47DRAFT_172935 [Mycena vitilis]
MIPRLSLFLCLALSTFVTAAPQVVGGLPATRLLSRQQNNTNPSAGGSDDGGWANMPDVVDATSYPEWVLDASAGAKLPLYQTTGLDQSQVTRAVIVLPGKPRDCWYYWNAMNNALYIANHNDSTISRDKISIMAPCFWTDVDVKAGAASNDVLIWGNTTWVSGHDNTGPASVASYSSFDALDSLIAYYMNKTAYPNLNTVVLAGHSAGGQMVQRYVGLRKTQTDDDRLHFWIANPGSLMWLTEDRPAPNATCAGVDEFKYGLGSNFPKYGSKLKRDSVVTAYNSRNIHYAWGLKDNGAGDTRCEAETQGNTHLTRGQNFVSMLTTSFGWPANSTVDWVEGVSHDNEGMMDSAQGINKLFVISGASDPSSASPNSPSASPSGSSDSNTHSSGASSHSARNIQSILQYSLIATLLYLY